MPNFNDLYIDSFYVHTKETFITNILDGVSDLHSNISTTDGYKFIIELFNPTGATVNFASRPITLRFRTNYLNSSDTIITTHAESITVNSGSVAAGDHYYVGWNSIVSGITMDSQWNIYVADLEDHVWQALQLLYDTGNGLEIQDRIVDNDDDTEESLIGEILGELESTSGLVHRDPGETYDAPNDNFVGYDTWFFSSTDIQTYLETAAQNLNPNFTDLYIDSFYVHPQSTLITNILDGVSDLHSNISTTDGYKFIIELFNPTNTAINFASRAATLRIRTNYVNTSNNIVTTYTTDLSLNTGTVAAGDHYYVGWNNIVSGITMDSQWNIYVADLEDHVWQALQLLYDTGNGLEIQDRIVDNDDDTEESLIGEILGELESNHGMIRRKAYGIFTAPRPDFAHSDWRFENEDYYSHLMGAAAGDPHITTLTGDHYEFDYLGAFRLFEDTIQGNKIIINGLSEKGPGRWSKKQYIQKLYIQHNQKYILVDMGFRGSPVKVLENYQMDYTEEDLPFDSEAKRYSFNSTYRTQDQDEPVTEDLPTLIRNQFSLLINSEKTLVNIMHITLQNVNQYNLQPCRFSFTLNKITDKAKGCLVDRKYAPVSKLLTIKDTKELPEPNKEDLDKMPELEIDPKLRNIQWQ